MPDSASSERTYWDHLARYDPLWAILSDPAKVGRRWGLRQFMETGRREVSLLMHQLRALAISVERQGALDFGCGVGRLSQALASHFDRVVGVDVSPEMLRLANTLNRHPHRVRYVHNDRNDLALFASGGFAFAYSNVVLQHIEPIRTQQYLRELLRVVAPDGVLVFQLPSHRRPSDEQRLVSTAMTEQAYRAAIRIGDEIPHGVTPGSQVLLTATVTNISGEVWSQAERGPIRLGNHWLDASGDEMIVQDDGRAPLPTPIDPGQSCRVTLAITLPPEPGGYQLECDVVHEGISWFGDRGSGTWRAAVLVGVGEGPSVSQSSDELDNSTATEETLPLPELSSLEPPGPLPMHGLHLDVVRNLVDHEGGRFIHVETDERCGPEWVGYRYFVRKEA